MFPAFVWMMASGAGCGPHNSWHSLGHLRRLDRPATAPGDRYFFMNIDAQDKQDKQDERLLHQKPARAVIRCGRGCSLHRC